MNQLKRISQAASICILVAGAFASLAFTNVKPNVIYGEDNRVDVYQVSNQALLDVADSTVALIPSSSISSSGSTSSIAAETFGQSYGLCKDEPFANQPNGAICSGFLVGPDLIATAGHCVTNAGDCAGASFVFGYKMKDEKSAPTSVPTGEVYHCKEIVAREQTPYQDYGLIRLDRVVVGHKVLRLSTKPVQVNDEILVIGHPVGLPTKIAGGASVRSTSSAFFVANLDTYGGNSGSAVFDAKTLEVVGVLVRGEQDFAYDSQNSCNRSHICKNDGCRGEDTTNISYIQKALGQ